MRGAMLFMGGRSDDALRNYETVVAMFPTDSRAWCDLGTVHHYRNDPAAVGDYTKAIHADGTNFRALSNRGALYLMLDRPEDGKRDLEAAVRLNPNHLPGIYNLAAALQKSGDHAGALRRLDEILSHTPDHLRARITRAVFNYENKQWKAAVDDFEKAFAIDAKACASFRAQYDQCKAQLNR